MDERIVEMSALDERIVEMSFPVAEGRDIQTWAAEEWGVDEVDILSIKPIQVYFDIAGDLVVVFDVTVREARIT